MKTDRIYPALIVVIFLLLVASGILAYKFYGMLSAPPTLGSETGPAATGAGEGADAASAARAARLRERGRSTGGGETGKWQLRSPAFPPTGSPAALAGWPPDRHPGAPPFLMGLPVVFDELCDEYDGEFSLLTDGAGLDMLFSPGSFCFEVHRPVVDVPENETRMFTVGETTYSACDLDRSLNMCLSLGDLSLDAQGRAWHPIYTPTPRYDARDPTNILETWHEPFLDEGDAAEQESRVVAEAPSDDQTAAIRETTRNYYFLGNDPRTWFSDLPYAAQATLKDIKPGVDLSCYADQNRIEYVFTFWPGVNPVDIEFTYDTADAIREISNDNVAIDYQCATLFQHRPFAYKWVSGLPYPVDARYVISGKTLRLDILDPGEPPAPPPGPGAGDEAENRRPLIDCLSFLGGAGDEDGYATALDNQGYAYVAGATTLPSFGGHRRDDDAGDTRVDAFVMKYRIRDRKPVYVTFLGGRHDDRIFAIAADAAGNAYVCGETLSPDFATVTPPIGGVLGRGWDAFIAKLSPEGEIGRFACRFGGRGDDRAYAIALDAATNIYVAGVTASDNFPLTDGGDLTTDAGSQDGFVIKLAPDGQTLRYACRVGGSADDSIYDLALDRDGSAVVVGETASKDLPVFAAFQPEHGGGTWDGFAAKFTPDGRSLRFATYIGGRNDDRALAVAVDLARNVRVAGETASEDFPTRDPVQAGFAGGNWDAFVARIAAGGDQLLNGTYVGGSGDDRAFGLGMEASGRLHIAGATSSTNLPVLNAAQREHGGGTWDGFLAGFEEGGTVARYVTYLGGSDDDGLRDAAIEAGRILHVVGTTASADLDVVNPLQSAHRGGTDAFLARLLPEYPVAPPMRLVPAGGQPDGPAYDFYMATFEITNEEFTRFLNDAQANPAGPRGTNMFFDAAGSVWMNAEMVAERDELFAIHDSRLVYTPAFPIGSRYSVSPQQPRDGGSYERHPVVGVSWYGAVKYCNWLTIEAGRGAAQRCYREGHRSVDWAPVTCPEDHWRQGRFTGRQRLAWLNYRGFRLPMDNCGREPVSDPDYFVVSADEFADFLNDAQANPNSPRGTNMFYDAEGNVMFSDAMTPEDYRLFSIATSLLAYSPVAPVGRRYAAKPTPVGVRPAYAVRPVGGVTWYGAMKYCNWLTLREQQPIEQRCYREGREPEDWAPATASEAAWRDGDFLESERVAWLQLNGYRLPYHSTTVDTNVLAATIFRGAQPTNSWHNAFNEFLKAAGWSGDTNSAYGFGRSTYGPEDANYLDSGIFAKHDTTPVGFYDGTDHEGRTLTHTNDNLYGIYDLSGNVLEWLTDPGIAGSLEDRPSYGGAWIFPLTRFSDRFYVHPYFTDNFRGIRIVTTAPSEDMHVVRVPLRLCVCGYGVGAGCGRGAEGEEEKAEEGGPKKPGEALKVEGFEDPAENEGVVTRPGIGEEEEVPGPRPRPGPGPGPGPGPSESPGDDGSGAEQVVICHYPPGQQGARGQTIVVSINAVNAHLKHGDVLGPCLDDILAQSGNMIQICHWPPGATVDEAVTMIITVAELADHLAHGDYIGTCPNDDPTGPFLIPVCHSDDWNNPDLKPQSIWVPAAEFRAHMDHGDYYGHCAGDPAPGSEGGGGN